MGIKRPFLTIVTRCHRRPELLAGNIASVNAQTDKDIEHVLIPDFSGKGIPHANKLLYRDRHRVRGEYVYILDDDNELVDRKLVARLKRAADVNDQPHVFVVRGLRPTGEIKVFPDSDAWASRKLVKKTTNAHCYVVRGDVWKKHIKSFGYPATLSGAWKFPKALIREGGYRFVWLDIRAGRSVQLGRGNFDCEDDDWWQQILDAHKDIEQLSDGDYRRLLWLQGE